MNPQIRAAREPLKQAVDKALEALKATEQFKQFEAVKAQLVAFDQALNVQAETNEVLPVAEAPAPRTRAKNTMKGSATVRRAGTTGEKLKKDGTPRKKPGPKPKAAAKVKPVAKAKKTAKQAKAAKPAPTTNRKAVANGSRPPLYQAVAMVMAGKDQMSIDQVLQELEKRGWSPDSEKPHNYISFIFSSNKEVFDRVKRGVYRVKPGVSFAKTSRKPATTAPIAAAGKDTTEEELAALGISRDGVQPNPFAS